MQVFNLNNNPFYLLEVSPRDKRATIISKAEEKAFFLEDGSGEAAQATLLNPAKRLLVELDWFLDIDKKEIKEINKCIAENKEISTEGLSPISKINALLFNFSIMQDVEAYDIYAQDVYIKDELILETSEAIRYGDSDSERIVRATLVGTTEPTDELGEDGDIYSM